MIYKHVASLLKAIRKIQIRVQSVYIIMKNQYPTQRVREWKTWTVVQVYKGVCGMVQSAFQIILGVVIPKN